MEDKLASTDRTVEDLYKNLTKIQKQLEDIKEEVQNKDKIIFDQVREIESAKAESKEKVLCEKRRLKHLMERRLAAKQTEIERRLCFDAEKLRQLKAILNADDWPKMDELKLDIDLRTETSATETSEASMNSKCWPGTDKIVTKRKVKSHSKHRNDVPPITRTIKSSISCRHSNKEQIEPYENEENGAVESFPSITTQTKSVKNPSTKSSLRRLSTLLSKNRSCVHTSRPERPLSNASNCSFRNAVLQCLFRGSCSMFFKPNRSLNLSKINVGKPNCDDVWIEHRPLGNLEMLDKFVPPILTKKTVSSLSMKDITKNDASHYVLHHQEVNKDGELVAEFYKADIVPSAGGGAHIMFKDVVALLKSTPSNYLQKKSELGLKEVAERCTIAIECRGKALKIMKKKL